MLLFVVVVLQPVFVVHAQSNDIFAVPPSFTVEGVPVIKKSDVEHLFFDPSLIRSNLIWDVDRKNRSILVTDEKSYIYRVDSPMGQPRNLIDGRVPHTVRVSPKGGIVAFLDDKENADNLELYLWSSGSSLRKLSAFNAKDESVESVVWDEDGERLYYMQTDYDSKTSKLCLSDLSVSRCPLTDLKGIWNVIDVEGNRVLLKYWKASSNQQLHVYDSSTGKLMPLDELGNSTKGFFAQGHVFWLSEGSAACDSGCLFASNVTTGRKSRIRLPGGLGNLHDVKISPDGISFLIQNSRDGIDNLRVARLKGDALVVTVPSFIRGSFVVWNSRWLSESEIVYSIENVGKPASIESFDIRSRKTTAWTKERLPAQLEAKVLPPEVISWSSFDTKRITGYAVRPAVAKEKTPVLIFVHGGPQMLDRPTFSVQDLRLATHLGLTIIHTNIRGSKGFGNVFMNADDRGKRGDAVKDIQALLDWIGKQSDLDPERIFIRGESYGGFVALSAAMREPRRIKAVVAEYPMVSIRGFLSQSWIDEFAKTEYGDPKDELLMKRLDELSPLNNALRWNATPLFLTRGKLDERVPERDVLSLKNQLKDRGAEVWFVYSNEAGHGVGGRYVTAAMYEFLKKQIRRKQNEKT